MLNLEELMQQLAVLNHKKLQATEFFHQATGAIAIIEDLIKTHYPHPESKESEGDSNHEHIDNQPAE